MGARTRAIVGGRWFFLPVLPWIGYAALVVAVDRLRWDILLVAALATTAAYGGARARRFYLAAVPPLTLFVLYDALRYLWPASVSASRVIGCELRDVELAFFGVGVRGAVVTPNEWLAGLANPGLDLLCALPYGSYLGIMALQYAYLCVKKPDAARTFTRLALGTHVLGFATYLLLPAAPPWYVATHGCAIDLAAHGSPAALARIDAWMGYGYFASLYGHGAVVFGALPSLHVTYPLYGLIATYRTASATSRALQIVYAILMPFAAVYLGHHYVLDVALGLAYVGIVYGLLLVVAEAPFRQRAFDWPVADLSGSQSTSPVPRWSATKRLQTKSASLRRFR
jgi:inositol phosphorylceramide synthase catalytic subunit